MSTPNAAWAARYLKCYPHMALVRLYAWDAVLTHEDGSIEQLGKRPMGNAWNAAANLIRSPEEARRWWGAHPKHNVGLHLATSGMASVDLDDMEASRIVLEGEGLYIEELTAMYPTIRGRGLRLEFMAPQLPLDHLKLTWPDRDGKRDSYGRIKERGVLELRAGSQRCQDVLPPSWHPEMGRRYEWLTPPKDAFPVLPDSLLKLWTDWPAFQRRARLLCPWLPEGERQAPEQEGQAPRPRQPYTGTSVVDAFNARYSVEEMLKDGNHMKVGGRWLSPDSTSKRASIVVLSNREAYGGVDRVMCMSGSGPLADGKPHDAFDLFRIFKHKSDHKAAIRAAAQALGMDYNTQRKTKPRHDPAQDRAEQQARAYAQRTA